jgi:hypothetical protein
VKSYCNLAKSPTQHGKQLKTLAIALIIINNHCVPFMAYFRCGQAKIGAKTVDNQGAAGIIDPKKERKKLRDIGI